MLRGFLSDAAFQATRNSEISQSKSPSSDLKAFQANYDFGLIARNSGLNKKLTGSRIFPDMDIPMNLLPVKKSFFDVWRKLYLRAEDDEERQRLRAELAWCREYLRAEDDEDRQRLRAELDRKHSWILSKMAEPFDPSCVSMKSDRSKDLPWFFKSTNETGSKSSDYGFVSMKSDRSKDLPWFFKSHDKTSETGGKRDLGSIFQLLKENIVSFVKTQLKWCQKVLSTDSPDILGQLCGENEEADQKIWSSRDAFLTITLDFMRTMNLGDLADSLQNKLNFIVRGTSADISEASSQRARPNRSFMMI
ncbi:uncharacterized protein LOC121513236 isoform X2 [Cheilinus undulatus]|uniref:uncharacterized protein LOC121513236 isoform X2 n=1 Tax=Cheilinus undulatus TaxID=241271 RepID=UPI001BD451B0|nr:uncharacterized protein LOC121513236 isoform X2 [Cheilinus undulatus]